MKKIEKKKITEEQKKKWFKAVGDSDIKTVKKMIEDGFNIKTVDENGWTALHWSCYYNRIEIVNFLIENSADVNIQDNVRWTPFRLACLYANLRIAKLLIEKGADITVRDDDGETPIGFLRVNNPKRYQELTEWLTEHHPEKALELMASESVQGNGIGL